MVTVTGVFLDVDRSTKYVKKLKLTARGVRLLLKMSSSALEVAKLKEPMSEMSLESEVK